MTSVMRDQNDHSPALRACGFARRSRQGGQAVLWFLATIAACCATFALVYNVGQVSGEKEKTINAADAAALSGALVEARILNFEAYANRAMIANEVTIAQMVSADSFVAYDATMAQYLCDYICPIPIVGQILEPALQGYATALQYAQMGVDYAAPVVIRASDLAIDALKIAREGAYFAAPAAADGVASGVAEANMTTFGGRFDTKPELNPALRAASLVANTNDWLSFTKAYDGNDRGNARDVILASRDQFSTKRGMGPLINAINVQLEISTGVASAGTSYLGLEKTSDTTTLTDFDHWAAQDSLDLYVATLQFCFGFIPCGYEKTYIPPPLGYGRADASTQGDTGKDLCHPSFPTPFGTTLNCHLAVQNGNAMTADGIPNIRDLAKPGGPNTPDPTLTFVAGVQKSADATLTTQRIGMNTVQMPGPQGSPDLKDNLQNGDRLTSIATARVFFARPDWSQKDITAGDLPRPDRKHEYASLYNPYWQARLTPTDDATRAGFYALIGANPLLSGATP